jgi:surface polysaccharide O-acyltransferase-like enzyme
MSKKVSRNSNIELLRIISMLMVLVLHCLSGGAL